MFAQLSGCARFVILKGQQPLYQSSHVGECTFCKTQRASGVVEGITGILFSVGIAYTHSLIPTDAYQSSVGGIRLVVQ
jgi:hypothetical protein